MSIQRALLACLLSFSTLAPSDADARDDIHTPEGAVELSEKMNACLKSGAPKAECPKGAPTPCSQVSDQFCKELWGSANRGNMVTPDGGQILAGLSPKSSLSNALKLDIEALTDSERNLPADFRAKVAPILSRLRKAMGEENDSSRWARRVGGLLQEIQDARDEVADDRAEAAHPELKSVRVEDRRLPQLMQYRDAQLDLDGEILRAKYEHHPNWNRVKNMFDVVKADLLDAIGRFHVSDAEKDRMREKVRAIKLVMPYADPRVYGNDGDCGHSEVNAAYMSNLNVFSVCAGYFNSYQDPDAIYFVMAHELSHSIDPVTSGYERFIKTPAGAALQKFCNAKGPAMACDEWAKLRASAFTHVKNIPEADYPLKKLSSCLKSTSTLRPFANPVLHETAFESSNGIMDNFAEPSAFSYVAQPLTLGKDGQTKPNALFMRPDLVRAAQNKDVPQTGTCEDGSVIELFTQSLSCQKTPDGRQPDFSKLTAPERGPLFAAALAETQDVEAAASEHWYSVCGRDCPDLVRSHMSRNSQEDFADWLAHKAFERYIGRHEGQSAKRESVAAAGALFCPEPSPLALAPDLTVIEKHYDYEVHPDERVRRMSFFTPSIVQDLGCQVDASTKEGTGSCEL